MSNSYFQSLSKRGKDSLDSFSIKTCKENLLWLILSPYYINQAANISKTSMHYRAISYVNLPTTYDEAILAQFVVHHATDSNRTIRVECLRCHHTCQIFKCRFAVSQLSVNCWYTAGRQLADSIPTDFSGSCSSLLPQHGTYLLNAMNI